MDVNFKVQGDRSIQTILLIHGGGESLSVWDAWLAQFGDQFCFVTVELPGHGLTAPYLVDIYLSKRFSKFVARIGSKHPAMNTVCPM